MLDPTPVSHTRPGFIWPRNDLPADDGGGGLAVGWRAFTFHGMARGDAMIWRTTKVPHASAKPLAPQGNTRGGVGNFTTHQRRQSVDFRCTCLRG